MMDSLGNFNPMLAIDVAIDLRHAVDAVNASQDQRTLLSARYNLPEVSEMELGAYLGWSGQRLERVGRSLRADRVVGGALRTRLALYEERLGQHHREKISQSAVREIDQVA
jgi:hypothetical protein